MKNKKKLQNCNKDYKYLNQIGINFESTQNSNHRTQKPNLKPIAISNQQFILSFNEIKIRSFSSYPKGINQRNNFSSILSKKNLDKKLPMANKDFSRFINYAETKKKNHLSNGLVIITQILLIFFFFSFILLGIKSIGPLIVESITGFGK
jgi:ATP-dependent Zn protease